MSNAEKQARYRDRKKALAAKEARQKLLTTPPPKLDDPAGAICQWAEDNLRVPAGHPLAGQPMRPPEYIEDFLRAGWDARESVLSIGRKNSKSGGLVILALAYLAGPVKQAGFKIGVWSYSKELASNFYKDAVAVVLASGLELEVNKSPWPGAIQNDIGGVINIHSADTSSPHSLGVDLAIIDELGLWPERKRELMGGIRSAISAKDGRIVICSIRSTGPMMAEALDNPETVKRVYEADKEGDYKDEKQWHKANPGLAAGIKSIAHMRDQVARLEHAPQDVNFFKAHELNMPLAPTVEVLITPEQMSKCFTDEPPEAIGPCYVRASILARAGVRPLALSSTQKPASCCCSWDLVMCRPCMRDRVLTTHPTGPWSMRAPCGCIQAGSHLLTCSSRMSWTWCRRRALPQFRVMPTRSKRLKVF